MCADTDVCAEIPPSTRGLLLQVDRLPGGGRMTRAVAENHCRANGSAGTSVGSAGGTGHCVARGEQTSYGLTADMEDAAIGVGARAALGAIAPTHTGTA